MQQPYHSNIIPFPSSQSMDNFELKMNLNSRENPCGNDDKNEKICETIPDRFRLYVLIFAFFEIWMRSTL